MAYKIPYPSLVFSTRRDNSPPRTWITTFILDPPKVDLPIDLQFLINEWHTEAWGALKVYSHCRHLWHININAIMLGCTRTSRKEPRMCGHLSVWCGRGTDEDRRQEDSSFQEKCRSQRKICHKCLRWEYPISLKLAIDVCVLTGHWIDTHKY